MDAQIKGGCKDTDGPVVVTFPHDSVEKFVFPKDMLDAIGRLI